MKTFQKIILCALATVVMASGCVSPLATALYEWSGRANVGVLVSDADCPVVVEKEVVTYDIPTLPMGKTGEPNSDYSGSVTTEYALYNPTAEALTLDLLLPVNEIPEYYREWGKENYKEVEYSLTVDGEELPYTTCHVAVMGDGLVTSADSFGITAETYIEDDFYTPDLKVTVYTYGLGPGMASMDAEGSRYCGFTVPQLGEGTKVAFYGMECYGTYYNRDEEEETAIYAAKRYSTEWMNADIDMTLRVYFLGEPPAEPPQPRVFLRWNEENNYFRDEIIGGDYLSKDGYAVTEMTLLELADSLYPENSEFSRVDWYNALISKMLCDEGENPHGVLTLDQGYRNWSIYDFDARWTQEKGFYSQEMIYRAEEIPDLRDSMVPCYAYSLTIGPGERLNHQIRMPLYPSIWDEASACYKFLYILSAARGFADHGETEILIRTPYTLQNCSFSFVPDDDGYKYTATGIPEEELYFELTAPRPVNTNKEQKETVLNTDEIQVAEPVAKQNLKPWLYGAAAVFVICAVAVLITVIYCKKK